MLRIRFSWFWKGFDHEDNFFVHLLQSMDYEPVIVYDKDQTCDIEFVSVFAPRIRILKNKISSFKQSAIIGQRDLSDYFAVSQLPDSKNSKIKVWYTAENIRPPIHLDYDLFLSFDHNSYGGRNIRLPYWQIEAGLLKATFNPRFHDFVEGKNLQKGRIIQNRNDRIFSNIIASNRSPLRDFLALDLGKFEKVDCYGKNYGNPLISKSELKDKYKFVLAFENDFYPGYVTEKLLEGYLLGAVPIYWGGIKPDEGINPRAYIDYSKFDTHEEFRNYLLNLSNEEYELIFEQPFLSREVKFDSLKIELNRLISN